MAQLDAGILRPPLAAGLPDLLGGEPVAGQIARQPQHRRGVQVSRALPHDCLELLAGVERASRLEQDASELIPQVVEAGSECERSLVLFDRLRQAARFEVGFPQRGVQIGELGREVAREALASLRRELPGAAEGLVGLGLAAELVQHDRAVDQRLHVMRVQVERAVELRQRRLRLAHQRIRQPEQMMRVGEGAARRNHLLEEVNRAVIVLELEALPGLFDHVFRTDVHGWPRTSARTGGSRPRPRPEAGTRARARRAAGRPR